MVNMSEYNLEKYIKFYKNNIKTIMDKDFIDKANLENDMDILSALYLLQSKRGNTKIYSSFEIEIKDLDEEIGEFEVIIKRCTKDEAQHIATGGADDLDAGHERYVIEWYKGLIYFWKELKELI